MPYQILYDDGYRFYSFPERANTVEDAIAICQKTYNTPIEFALDGEGMMSCNVIDSKEFNAVDFTLFLLEDE